MYVQSGRHGIKDRGAFLKLAMDYSIRNSISEVYLTHFSVPEKDELVDLICEYGFEAVGLNRRGETIYLKKMFPTGQGICAKAADFHKRYWPCFCDGPETRKFIVPIRPAYHDRLFVELKERVSLFEMAGEMIVEGNTIKKAYLCHSRLKRLSAGSVLLFYRSQTKQAVTALGVVEAVFQGLNDADTIMKAIDRRTVYGRAEIVDMMKKPTTVLLFTWHFYLPRPVTLGALLQESVLRRAPQSITEISHKAYCMVKSRGGIDERFAFN